MPAFPAGMGGPGPMAVWTMANPEPLSAAGTVPQVIRNRPRALSLPLACNGDQAISAITTASLPG